MLSGMPIAYIVLKTMTIVDSLKEVINVHIKTTGH